MSNKTPNDSHDAIVSVPSHSTYRRFKLVLLTAVVAVVFGLFVSRQHSGAHIELADRRFRTEVMDTDQARTQGLSGRGGLDADAAMLFVFNEPGKRCFWMKDMQFAIDILWFDGARRLIHQERAVLPETYPESYCVHGAQYVVEFVAGTAEAIGVELGDALSVHSR